ncbi:MAG: hypothetical protein HUU29_06460 [Planctomycetaceae bacterium]|nr:hypothetical protein [Planctomycetaceae bacterium]
MNKDVPFYRAALASGVFLLLLACSPDSLKHNASRNRTPVEESQVSAIAGPDSQSRHAGIAAHAEAPQTTSEPPDVPEDAPLEDAPKEAPRAAGLCVEQDRQPHNTVGDAPSNAGVQRTVPKLWFSLPGHLDNSKEDSQAIEKLFRNPTAEFKRVLASISMMELRCTALKGGALADDGALKAVIDAAKQNNVPLVVRVGVLGRAERRGFQKDLDALKRVEQCGGDIHGVICESVLSSAKKRTGLSKGEQVDERADSVADSVELIREALAHDVRVYIGDTSLAQGQKPNRMDKYDFAQDTDELVTMNAKRNVTIAGFIEAFNIARMSEDAHEIAAAAGHLATRKCESGIVPINDETDPKRYQERLVEQVRTIRRATSKLDWIASSTWNRREGVPTLEQHVRNTLAILDTISK